MREIYFEMAPNTSPTFKHDLIQLSVIDMIFYSLCFHLVFHGSILDLKGSSVYLKKISREGQLTNKYTFLIILQDVQYLIVKKIRQLRSNTMVSQ